MKFKLQYRMFDDNSDYRDHLVEGEPVLFDSIHQGNTWIAKTFDTQTIDNFDFIIKYEG